jgi:hypothetical protein
MATQRAVNVPNRLGRLVSIDERDKKHPLSLVTPKRAARSWKTWRTGPVLNQGPYPRCVAFAWTQFLMSSPMMTKLISPPLFAKSLYMRAQALDEWEGENYDGTSVRGGAKALEEQGRLVEYLWSFDEDEIRRYVLSRGGIVLGIDWFEGFDRPKLIGGEYWLEPTGDVIGGHAIFEYMFSSRLTAHGIINSWGENYARRGRARIHRDVMKDLAARPGFEACSAVEKKVT